MKDLCCSEEVMSNGHSGGISIMDIKRFVDEPMYELYADSCEPMNIACWDAIPLYFSDLDTGII